jgi:ribonuclease D
MIPIITDTPALVRLAEELQHEDAVAVDLEADSMHNYREKVCLLQFSTPAKTTLVDPLAAQDLSPLRPVMADPAVRKIFHAADYDIRSLYRDFKIEIKGLFDTMICCQFLGEKKVGLADMLAKYFNVKLDKKYQKADWSRRPLPDEMIHYAAEDTRHLHKLASLLEKEVEKKGRTSWVEEECSLLEKVRHSKQEGPLFLRAKGARALNQRQLAVLEGLLQWRDNEAQRRDCPPFKVVGNKQLMDLARAMPQTLKEIGNQPGIFPRLVDRYGRTLLIIIQTALALPREKLPRFPPPQRHERIPEADARLKKLKKFRTRKAGELQMDPGILINTALLETISRKPPATMKDFDEFPAMKKWQQKELGKEIIDVLKQHLP